MELDLGKLFVGGISWDTDEDRLRDYFGQFGDVVEAIILKDRSTGRSRGFGFVVFSDPGVAEQVVMERHIIDGRMVEAKKAVPRDDRSGVGREESGGVFPGSPGIGGTSTKKIFVGGLPSALTESEFRGYFEQFGAISDVVVMYDHNTQRPRGFGFITFESENSVEKVLLRTFHELNGKMVEVKRAVPREQSPMANARSPVSGFNYGLNRLNTGLNGHNQSFSPSLVGGYGMRIDDRLGLTAGERTGLSPFSGYGMGINLDPRLNPGFGGNSSLSANLPYLRALNPYISGNSSRYDSAIGYGNGNNSSLSSAARNIWGGSTNGRLNYGANLLGSDSYLNSGGSLNFSGLIGGRNVSYENGENNFGTFARSGGGSAAADFSRDASNAGSQGAFGSLYDRSWQSSSSELDDAVPLGYGLANPSTDFRRNAAGFMGGYNISNAESINGIPTE